MNWYDVKEAVELFTGLDNDALHVHAGVLGQLFTALVLRRSLRSPWPWLAVLAAAVANEAFDLNYEVWSDREMQYDRSIGDIWNTMLLPTLLLVLARVMPGLLVRRPPAPAADEA